MKELNQLENRLRSWTRVIRRPSIKRRLFPEAAALERELPDPINWRWLAPAMALCIAALIVLANNRHSGFGEPFRLPADADLCPEQSGLLRPILPPPSKATGTSSRQF